MMSTKKIIETNRNKFEKWEEQLTEHYDLLNSFDSYSKAERDRVFFQSNELLFDIANNFFLYGKFKDTWDTSKCHLNFMGQNLLLRSEKMNITFDWGLDSNEYYLESYIMYAENIRYMNDDFWSDLLELRTLGELEYTGSGFISAKERPYFENKTSTVFQLIRNFMRYQVEKMDGTNYQQPPSMDLGQIVIKWHVDTDFETLLEQTCKAFKILYSLNYKLWKINDLAQKTGNKR